MQSKLMQEIFPGELFLNHADYDLNIRQLLPRYDEMLDILVDCIPRHTKQLLELGCGTGELTGKILSRFPDIHIIAVDYSPRMLDFASAKLAQAGYAEQVSWIRADFGNLANLNAPLAQGAGFDVCVSSLAIHHLTAPMKQKVFEWIGENLQKNGCFWNGDLVLPDLPNLLEVYQKVREEWAVSQGTTLTNIQDQIAPAEPQGYSHEQQMGYLLDQVAMLKTAGFHPVMVPWKYYQLAVFGGYVAQS